MNEQLIDWQLLMLLLKKHYKALSAVGREVGIDWRTMNNLARGDVAEPRFGQAVRLLDLACDVLPPEEFRRVRNTQWHTQSTKPETASAFRA